MNLNVKIRREKQRFSGKILHCLAGLLALSIALAACKSQSKGDDNIICDCNKKVNSIKMTDLEGTVHFNENIQQWYISTPKEGTYDEALLFIPCDMKEEYKAANNSKVIFSGTVFDLLSGLSNAPAGSSYYCIEISSFNLSQK
jgi:hypothetical protein